MSYKLFYKKDSDNIQRYYCLEKNKEMILTVSRYNQAELTASHGEEIQRVSSRNLEEKERLCFNVIGEKSLSEILFHVLAYS